MSFNTIGSHQNAEAVSSNTARNKEECAPQTDTDGDGGWARNRPHVDANSKKKDSLIPGIKESEGRDRHALAIARSRAHRARKKARKARDGAEEGRGNTSTDYDEGHVMREAPVTPSPRQSLVCIDNAISDLPPVLVEARIVEEPPLETVEFDEETGNGESVPRPRTAGDDKVNRRWLRLCVSAAGVLTVAGVLIGVLVAFVPSSTSTTPTLPPTTEPSNHTSIPTTPTPVPPPDFLPEFTKQAITTDTASPQAKAWQWVENHPEFDSMSTERKLQLMALSTLYFSTGGGKHWDPGFNGWLDSTVSECNWKGGDLHFDPKCTANNEYQELNLGEDGLKGSIPPEISFLSGLAELRLFTNALTGTIPTELGALTALSALKLSENSLSGAIPTELGALTALAYLSLYKNALTGTIPTALEALTALTTLSTHDNLLSGTTPSGLCDITYLNIDCDRVHCTCPSFYGLLPGCVCK